MARTANSMFALKLAVVSMGLMLIGGLVFLVAALMNKTSGSSDTCKSTDMTLPITANYTVLHTDENRVTLLIKAPEGHQILTIDLCSGAIKSNLNIRARADEAAAAAEAEKESDEKAKKK